MEQQQPPQDYINLEAIKKLTREEIVNQLTQQGLEVEIKIGNTIRKIKYQLIDASDESDWRLSITDENGEFAYYDLSETAENMIIESKEYHEKATTNEYEGKGVIKLGFSLLAEYCRNRGFKKIIGKIYAYNLSSRKSRDNAIDLTKGGTFQSSTRYLQVYPGDLTSLTAVTTL